VATENDQITVHVIGPGYGESIVIQFPDGSVGVIDPYCSKTESNQSNRAELHPLIRFLDNRLRPERILFVLVTHPHSDHCLGTSQFLQHFSDKIERLWVFDAFHSATIGMNLLSLKEHGKKVDGEFEPGPILDELESIDKWIAANESKFDYANANTGPVTLPVNGITMDFYAPTSQVLREFHGPIRNLFKDVTILWESLVIPLAELPTLPNLNHLSVVTKLTWHEARLLFCADAEESTWDQMELEEEGERKKGSVDIHSQFVKVSHHGSANGYNDRMFPFFRLKALPEGILTPYNRGKKLPSTTALSELSIHFRDIYTTCFPAGPNLNLWEPFSRAEEKPATWKPPRIPGAWLNLITKDKTLKDAVASFPRDEALAESVPLPFEWIQEIVDTPDLMYLLREPYRSAASVLVEKKTWMPEDLFRAAFSIDSSGHITSRSFSKGCAAYKKP
jgi:hypothetical protein